MIKKVLSCVCVLCLIVTQLHGQVQPVRVIDHTTGKPVPFAHFKVTDLKSKTNRYFVTDTAGVAEFSFDKPVEIAVTFVGYKNYFDTLYPGKPVEVRLIPDVISFEELVVTAQYSPVSADRSLYKIKVINAMQIQKKAAFDLAGLLRTQMNIRLSQDGAIGTGMSMQGLSGENVKILVNGVPVIGRLNGVIDLSQINLQQAQQVEVIEGPMSVIYGSNALAGVINIIPRDNQSEKAFINLNSYVESVGVYNFDGIAGFKKGPHSFIVSGGRNFFGGYPSLSSGRLKAQNSLSAEPDEILSQSWKPKRQVNADVNYTIKLRKLNIMSNLSHFDELLLSKGALLPPYYERAFDNHFHTRRLTGKLSFATVGRNNFSMDNSFSTYKRTRTLWYNNLVLLEKTHIEDDITEFRSFLSRGIYTFKYDPADFGFQTGYDINSEWAEGQRIGTSTKNITDAALFLSMQYKPVCYLSLQPGLRIAYNSEYNSPVVYAFHVKAGPFSDYTLRSSFSSGFRSPSLKELYMNFVDVNHNIIGNTNLEAETSRNIQLAITKKISARRFTAEAEVNLFANNINNIITLAEMPDKSYTYVNVDIYRTRGYNLTFRSFWNKGFDLRLGYGSTGTSGNSETTKNKFVWSPEVTSEASYTIRRQDISIAAFYKYNGAVPRFLVDEEGTVSNSNIDDYHTLDISMSKSFLKKHLTVTAGGKNLFNVTDITATGAQGGVHEGSSSSVPVAWGRTAFIKISYDLKVKNAN